MFHRHSSETLSSKVGVFPGAPLFEQRIFAVFMRVAECGPKKLAYAEFCLHKRSRTPDSEDMDNQRMKVSLSTPDIHQQIWEFCSADGIAKRSNKYQSEDEQVHIKTSHQMSSAVNKYDLGLRSVNLEAFLEPPSPH